MIVHTILQLGIILLLAKIAGELFKRTLNQPEILGELLIGVAIGPYALGNLIRIPSIGPLFPRPETAVGFPISNELLVIAQIALIILFFSIGLEMDLRGLIRYGGPAVLVSLSNLIIPFVLGIYITFLFGYATAPSDPRALFMGAILAAPSIGIAARILESLRQLRTPEGAVIMGSGMIGSILVILILATVEGIASGQSFQPAEMALTASRNIGIWLGFTAGIALLSRYLSNILRGLGSRGSGLAIALALAFIAAALFELLGLAAIIGAFSLGLGLSNSRAAHPLRTGLEPIYNTMVPVFFITIGMLLDFRVLAGVFAFGVLVTLAAILSKIIGGGLPAIPLGFNQVGALRIGFGMAVRGSFTLAIAVRGAAIGAIGPDIFGVAVMITFITVLIAPSILTLLFQSGGEGKKTRKDHTV
ncbi:MAG: cation:proton antiporter [Candidatus Bipolaricaulia bacterium]